MVYAQRAAGETSYARGVDTCSGITIHFCRDVIIDVTYLNEDTLSEGLRGVFQRKLGDSKRISTLKHVVYIDKLIDATHMIVLQSAQRFLILSNHFSLRYRNGLTSSLDSYTAF